MFVGDWYRKQKNANVIDFCDMIGRWNWLEGVLGGTDRLIDLYYSQHDCFPILTHL